MGSEVEISSALLARLLAEAAATPEQEVCGLLFGKPDRIVSATACRNAADDPAHRFEIDPAALIAAHRAERAGGARLVGCYHSHPGGAAARSARDAADAAPDHWLWLIVAGGAAGVWRAVRAGDRFGRFDGLALRVTGDCASDSAPPEGASSATGKARP